MMRLLKHYRQFLFGVILGGLLGLLPGFGLGVYFLPILVEQEGAQLETLMQAQQFAEKSGTFSRDLRGSDRLHWGEGIITLSREAEGYYLTLDGKVAPGPDYRLYFTEALVEDEAAFLAVKEQAAYVGEVKAYTNFRLAVPPAIDVARYGAVIVWCERFGEFITAAELQ